MTWEYLFVSCDIIAHSAERDLQKQRKNVVEINHIVGRVLKDSSNEGVVWASGGDGGHVAFPTSENLDQAVRLLLDLRDWSKNAGVDLRVTASRGNAIPTQGADGRTQLVGEGINLAGRLLSLGGKDRVIVTEGFVELAEKLLPLGSLVHDRRTLRLDQHHTEPVFLLSLEGTFESVWPEKKDVSEKTLLAEAEKAGDLLEVIYRAKRLLEVNPENPLAKAAIRKLSIGHFQNRPDRSFIFHLLQDEQFGLEIVHTTSLIERRRNDILCEYGDGGATMFLILRGEVGVFFPSSKHDSEEYPAPDTVMSPGELAGELAFALHRPRTATLRCMEDTALLAFSYDDLVQRLRRSKVGSQLEEALNRKLLCRVVENIWNMAELFSRNLESASLSSQAAPWVTLLNHSEMITQSWQAVDFDPTIFDPSFEGVCFLASGSIQQTDSGEVLDAERYPVLLARFPNVPHQEIGKCTLRADVRLVTIAKAAFFELGHECYHLILSRLQNSEKLKKQNAVARKTCDFDVFLSHNSNDKPFVQLLSDELDKRGIKVWMDDEQILSGMPLLRRLELGLQSSKSIAVLFGPSGIGPWEGEEIAAAFELAVREGRTVIPIRLPGTEEEHQVPLFLRTRKWIDMSRGASTEALASLVRSISEANGSA